MADPLYDPAYLLSIVEIITDSLHEHSSAFIHDLLDAYTIFVNRVRSHGLRLEACDTLLPALSPIKIHKNAFIRALRRDVRLAHIDPLSSLSRPRLSLDESSFGSNIHLDINFDAKQYARNSSSLCQHALCVATTIFRFPAFHSVFPEQDLSVLFSDVLHIALAAQLPILNEAKTYSLSLLALSCHRLPAAVLYARQDDVFSALQRCLRGERQPTNIVLDGLKAISHTMEFCPSGFLELLFPLLPQVIESLRHDSTEIRLHASVALGKFAIALTHQTEFSLTKWQRLSDHITSVLESCCDESWVAAGNTSFSCIVRAAFSAESHERPGDTPAGILAVLASWIVICGPTLYSKPTVLRFILRALAMTLTCKRSAVRALHPHVWRCFVWTFSQMLSSSENVQPTLISSAFHVIKQEVSGGIGVALASVLLSDRVSQTRSDERADRVSQALSVIKAMVRTECKHTRQEGFSLLQALTNRAQAEHHIMQNTYETPASVLLNGVISGAKWDSLPWIVHSIPKVVVSIHRLKEAEIVRHYKTLLSIWKHFTLKVDRKERSLGLVDVWFSILHLYSHQLECGPHDATTAAPTYAATIIIEFLPLAATGDLQLDWGSWDACDQLCSLTFIDQLWSAMQKAFVTLSLTEAAALVLTSILKHTFRDLDPCVQTLWSKLCASLMVTVSHSFLYSLTASQPAVRSQRELWGVVAISLSSSEFGLGWKEIVQFLAIPICAWVLSEPELGAWEVLLRSAIALSGDSTTVIEHLIRQHFQVAEVETWGSFIAVLKLLLTCTHGHDNSPADGLLSMVDIELTASYSRACHSPELLTQSLELLNGVRYAIASAPRSVMRILQALRGSLCLWIGDHAEVMSDEEFDSAAVSLYCETLKVLEDLPLSIQSLQDMETFLASAFCRIPTPAKAPFAFEKFWRGTYYGCSQFYNILPPKIRFCLNCFVAAYGGDLADGSSLVTESQSQSLSDGFQAHSSTSLQRRESRKPNGLPSPPSISVGAEAWPEVFTMDVASSSQQTFTSQENTTFLIPSSNDDALRPAVLRQLQEYSGQMGSTSPDGSERSASKLQTLLSLSGITSRFHTPERTRPVALHVSNWKRKPAVGGDGPRKRSQTSWGTLRSLRKLDSEPVSRDITPISVPRTGSMPPKKRMVFDGVEVPILQGVSHRERVKSADKDKSTLRAEQDHISFVRLPLPCCVQRKSTSPSSDKDDLDWEDFHIDSTSLEADINRSPSSVLSRTPVYEPENQSHLLPGPSSPRASQSEGSLIHTRMPLRRTKTTSTRLDALQDVYSSVTNGASQIPMSELLQATRLVHQIGAVLTEQMDKKMGGPG